MKGGRKLGQFADVRWREGRSRQEREGGVFERGMVDTPMHTMDLQHYAVV